MNTPCAIFWLVPNPHQADPELEGYLASFGLPVEMVSWRLDHVPTAAHDAVVLVLDLAAVEARHWLAITQTCLAPGRALLVLLPPCAAHERAAVLEQGADDCVSQPLARREVAARIQALLRRQHRRDTAAAEPARWLRFGPWVLDTQRRSLSGHNDAQVDLSMSEYRLLMTFLQQPCQVFTRDRLMDQARGRGLDAFERSIDLLVSRLRHKLGDDPKHPRIISTVRGQGYIFNTPAAQNAGGLLKHRAGVL